MEKCKRQFICQYLECLSCGDNEVLGQSLAVNILFTKWLCIAHRINRQAIKLLFSMLCVFTSITSSAQTAPLVEVAKVKAWSQGAAHNMHCIVEAPDIYQLSSHADARLIWSLPEGAQVKKGEIVARQDSYYLNREIEQLEIDIASASAESEFAAKELSRLKLLNKKQLISISRFHDVSKQAKQASLAKKLLTARLKELHYRHKNLAHFAPEDGQVVYRQANLGESLRIGERILQFLPTTRNELMCEIPLQKYRQSQQLKNVEFTHENKGNFELIRQSHALDEKSQTLKIYLNAGQKSRQGLLVGERINVTVHYHNSILTQVPIDAIELTENSAFVWQVQTDNKVMKVIVDVVETQENFFLVRSLLKDGDKVVTIGKQGLQDEQAVSTTARTSLASVLGAAL